MVQFKAYDQQVEVLGQAVLSVVDGMGAFKTLSYGLLEQHGMKNPRPDLWYSQQAWLDTFKAISEKVGPSLLFLIGQKIPETAKWPPDVKELHDALASIDIAYHMNHRLMGKVLLDPATNIMTEGIGHYQYHKVGEKEAKMVCDNPYPCEFDRGIIEAATMKFKPQNAKFTLVKHADNEHCRKTGANSCTYFVTW